MCFGGSGAPNYTKTPAEPLPDLSVTKVDRKPITYSAYKPQSSVKTPRSLLMLGD